MEKSSIDLLDGNDGQTSENLSIPKNEKDLLMSPDSSDAARLK